MIRGDAAAFIKRTHTGRHEGRTLLRISCVTLSLRAAMGALIPAGDPRKRFGGNAGKPRTGSSWGGKSSFGGNGGRPSSRDGGGYRGNYSGNRGRG